MCHPHFKKLTRRENVVRYHPQSFKVTRLESTEYDIQNFLSLHAANNPWRTDTSENKSIISQIKKLYNEITHKILSCFIKNYGKKTSLGQKKVKEKKRKDCVKRRARDDRNLNA